LPKKAASTVLRKGGGYPRRLADYERFGFAQISRMSLNTLLRLFSEPDFDEMRRVYSYNCYFMPDGVCQEKVQSFGNEARAKAQMKNHLQSHIKDTLKRDDYNQFTAEPVAARKKRLVQQQKGTNNNALKDDIIPVCSSSEGSATKTNYTSTGINSEFSNMLASNANNQFLVDEKEVNISTREQGPQDNVNASISISHGKMFLNTRNVNSATQMIQANDIHKTGTTYASESVKENVPTNRNRTRNASSAATIFAAQRDRETASSELNSTSLSNSSTNSYSFTDSDA
jgi:hypothetical protein